MGDVGVGISHLPAHLQLLLPAEEERDSSSERPASPGGSRKASRAYLLFFLGLGLLTEETGHGHTPFTDIQSARREDGNHAGETQTSARRDREASVAGTRRSEPTVSADDSAQTRPGDGRATDGHTRSHDSRRSHAIGWSLRRNRAPRYKLLRRRTPSSTASAELQKPKRQGDL